VYYELGEYTLKEIDQYIRQSGKITSLKSTIPKNDMAASPNSLPGLGLDKLKTADFT
jgi:hypothetical protein